MLLQIGLSYDDDLMRLHKRVKGLPVQQLVMGLDGEALVVAILPGPAAIDKKRLQANPGEQLPHCVRRKLGTVV